MPKKSLTVPTIKFNLIDRLIGVVNPIGALRRAKSRFVLSGLNASGYVTPSTSKRSMRGWFVRRGSADQDTIPDLDSARAGSRDLAMNTPVALGVLRRMKTNVIGAGLTFQSRVDRQALGLDDKKADAWEQKAEREFNLWAKSKDCDITRTQNFYQLQQLAYASYLLSGDTLILMPHKKVLGFPYSLRIKIIEGDMLENPTGFENPHNTRLRGGIETDENGAPVKYYVRTTHPGDTTVENKWIPVPAFGSRSGRRNVIHLFDKERPGQRRGMPFLAPVIEQLKQLTRFSDAELMAALVTSFFTAFVKSTDGNAKPFAEGFVPDTLKASDGDADEDQVMELGNGNIISLADGEDVTLADPKRPNDSFEPFFHAVVKQIGSALEIPFELIMLHFTSSYSASRGAILEGWKTFRARRANFIADFTQPIYEEFLYDAIAKGRLTARGFLTDPAKRAAWSGSRWGGPGQGQIDPKKETDASLARINGRLSTYEDESNTLGTSDWEQGMNRLSREKVLLDEKNLSPEDTTTTADEPTNGGANE